MAKAKGQNQAGDSKPMTDAGSTSEPGSPEFERELDELTGVKPTVTTGGVRPDATQVSPEARGDSGTEGTTNPPSGSGDATTSRPGTSGGSPPEPTPEPPKRERQFKVLSGMVGAFKASDNRIIPESELNFPESSIKSLIKSGHLHEVGVD